MGGRQVRTGAEFGHIFDHFAIDYEYPNNVHVLSMCRQTVGASLNVSEAVTAARGACTKIAGARQYHITGARPWTLPRDNDNEPYQAEHVALFESIRGRNRRARINDLRQVAESTLTAVMGRLSAYTGQNVSWEQAAQQPARVVAGPLDLGHAAADACGRDAGADAVGVKQTRLGRRACSAAWVAMGLAGELARRGREAVTASKLAG